MSIKAKTTTTAALKGDRGLPWMQPQVRSDLHVQLNTRQPERLMLQIEWLAVERGTTKRDLVEEALTAFAERELKRLGLPA